MKGRAAVVGWSAIVGLGCGGGDLCRHAAATFAALNAQASRCPSVGSPFQTYTEAQLQTCSASLPTCTSADLTEITRQLKCLDRVGPCVPGQETAFGNAIGSCSISALTPGCATF